MYLVKKMNSLLFTGVMGTFMMIAVPINAQAEISSSATLASMYLWRGQDISDHKPAVSGDIAYSHDSGLYASLWMSSEGTTNGSYETDWTIGFSGSMGDFGYDVGYYKIWYPEALDTDGDPVTFGDAAAEAYIGLSYMDIGFKAFLDAKDDKTYNYYTLSYGMGAFSGTLGFNDDTDDNDLDYRHLDLSYAATDS